MDDLEEFLACLKELLLRLVVTYLASELVKYFNGHPAPDWRKTLKRTYPAPIYGIHFYKLWIDHRDCQELSVCRSLSRMALSAVMGLLESQAAFEEPTFNTGGAKYGASLAARKGNVYTEWH